MKLPKNATITKNNLTKASKEGETTNTNDEKNRRVRMALCESLTWVSQQAPNLEIKTNILT